MIVGIYQGMLKAHCSMIGWIVIKINSPVIKNTYSLAFYGTLRFTCGWWIACNKAALVVSSMVLGAYLADVKNPVGVVVTDVVTKNNLICIRMRNLRYKLRVILQIRS